MLVKKGREEQNELTRLWWEGWLEPGKVQQTVTELLCDDDEDGDGDGAHGLSPPSIHFFFILSPLCLPFPQPRRRAPLRSLPAWTASVSRDAGDATENQSVPTARTRPRKPAVSGDSQHTFRKSHRPLWFWLCSIVFEVSRMTFWVCMDPTVYHVLHVSYADFTCFIHFEGDSAYSSPGHAIYSINMPDLAMDQHTLIGLNISKKKTNT